MITSPLKASEVLHLNRAKWAKHQPHIEYGVYWTTKIIKGAGASDKAYWAVSFTPRQMIPVVQYWNSDTHSIVWRVGMHLPCFASLEDAKEYAKDLILAKFKDTVERNHD